MKSILLVVLIMSAADIRLKAQSKAVEPTIVQGDVNACEVNAAMFDSLANILRSTDERLFIVARLGTGEISRELNRRRLFNVRAYFNNGWPGVEAKRFVFAEGDKSEGAGRVEFYLGSKLMLISLVNRGKDICVDCCEYPDPRYYGAGKRDNHKRKDR
jgi:hypothetical protein